MRTRPNMTVITVKLTSLRAGFAACSTKTALPLTLVARAMPLLAQNLTGMPDVMVSDPDLPLDEPAVDS
jgi:hypothetical protein